MNVKDLQDILTVLEKGNLLCEVTAASMLRELILKLHEAEIDNNVFGVKIIQADVVQSSGYIFPLSLMEKTVATLNDRIGVRGEMVPFETTKAIATETISHLAYNFRIENDWMIADITFTRDIYGRALKALYRSLVNTQDSVMFIMRKLDTVRGTTICGTVVLGIDACVKLGESK